MRFAQVVLAIFAPLMLVGGVAGWRAARSKASLIAGTTSAVVLAGALAISVNEPAPGFWLGALTSLALCIVFALRWSKTGKLMPQAKRERSVALQWLMFQMGGVGPMFGQVHHFLRAAKEPVPYAIERYTKETRRLYSVLDARLKDREYLADEYSIADIATYPWVARYEWHKTRLEDYPEVKRWFAAISGRPAVQKGMVVPG